MEYKGRRFKSENESAETVTEAEEYQISETDAEKAQRLKAKQSKKVEKMLAKKRRQSKDDSHRELDEDELISEEQVPSDNNDSEEAVTDEQDEKERAEAKDERLRKKNAKQLEKLMQKQRRREDKSDREVLSYEDMPLEDRTASKKKQKVRLKRKRIVLAGVIVLLLAVIVFLFTNSDRLSMHNIVNFIKYGIFNLDSDQRFPVQLRDERVNAGNFCRMGQDLCYATGSRMQTLNNYGKQMLTVQHGYEKPHLACSDKYSLIYDLNGVDYQINSLDEHIYTGKAKNKILVAAVTDKGNYALITESDAYLCELYVYNSDNKNTFIYSFSDYYVTSVTLKPNGKMAVVSGVSAHNGTEISSLYVLDCTKEAPAQYVELEDTVLYDVQFLDSTYAAAVGSKGAYVIDTDDLEVKQTAFEGKALTAYTFNTDTDTFSVALSRSGDGRNCDVYSFSTSGSLADSFTTELRVISISTYKNRVALLTPDTVYLYTKGGSKVGEEPAGIAPRSVVLYTSADAYILDTSEIRTVSP